MLNICCVKAGTKYGPEYVNMLRDMVARNLGVDAQSAIFVCFTDNPEGLDPGITIRELPGGLESWWNKLYLFSPQAFRRGARVLYFDLDVLIMGSLDELADYDGSFAILKDFYDPHGYNSSVMAWEAGRLDHIWEEWNLKGRPQMPGGDQEWIRRACLGRYLQDLFPGAFCSFKADCHPYPPKGTKVVVMHGEPKPHNCPADWVREVWKKGGVSGAEIDLVANASDEQRIANIHSALQRGLPTLCQRLEDTREVCIIGGGPSAQDDLQEILARHKAGQQIWALNGSHDWLLANGITPDAAWLVDARAENARFYTHPVRHGCTYYIASQCAPQVFGALDGCDVVLWHEAGCGPALPEGVLLVGGGTTVGMHAICGAYALGFRHVHLFGFDSSYRYSVNDDAEHHHAYAQDLSAGETAIVDAWCENKRFRTAPWMAQQVEDFQNLAPELMKLGVAIYVHGDGLLPHVARQLAKAQAEPAMTPAMVRAAVVAKRMNGREKIVGAEIGVFAGDMSQALMQFLPSLELFMVDSWEANGAAYSGDSGDFHAGLDQGRQNAYRDRAAQMTNFAADRRTVLAMRSTMAAECFANQILDFAFIDADHSYEGCKADIAAWLPKIKKGGWLCGHDYENHDFPKFGVTQAVNEFVASSGLTLEVDDNFTWFVHL